MKKQFPTIDVFSAASGFLLTKEVENLCEVLDFVTGESNFTHQLPRVSREFKAALLKQRPELAETFDYIKATCNRETWAEAATGLR